MPVNGIGYGSTPPLAPKQQTPPQDPGKDLAPKTEQKPVTETNSSVSNGSVDITV